MPETSVVPPVVIWSPLEEARATALSRALGVSIARERKTDAQQLYLYFDDDCLVLGRGTAAREHPVVVDFAALQRQRQPGRELLLRAIGGRRPGLNIVDCTAGLGQDAFLLASYGASLTLCERQPVVASLLADGLERGLRHAEVAETVSRMALRRGSAIECLRAGDRPAPDIVYLDPMFPPSGKSALVKKEMRLFHQLVGRDEDAEELLALALERARHRVVVKRPLQAPALAGEAPQFSIRGKAVRFDVYPLRRFAD